MPEQIDRINSRPREGGEKNYQAFDEVLDMIRESFLSLHHTFATEERWRWDTPVITFTWTNGHNINRNLNGLVLGAHFPTGLEVEANAWIDVDDKQSLYRLWQNFPVGKIDSASIRKESVSKLVEEAYQKVSTCSRDDLRNRIPLPRGT